MWHCDVCVEWHGGVSGGGGGGPGGGGVGGGPWAAAAVENGPSESVVRVPLYQYL